MLKGIIQGFILFAMYATSVFLFNRMLILQVQLTLQASLSHFASCMPCIWFAAAKFTNAGTRNNVK